MDIILGLLEKDNKACQMFLKLDERNFHVWNYIHLLKEIKYGLLKQEILDKYYYEDLD